MFGRNFLEFSVSTAILAPSLIWSRKVSKRTKIRLTYVLQTSMRPDRGVKDSHLAQSKKGQDTVDTAVTTCLTFATYFCL